MVKILQIDWEKEEKTGKMDNKNILRQIAKPVQKDEFGSVELKKIIKDMRTAMEAEIDGVAIAAPQIGISKRVFVIKDEAYNYGEKNPKWRPNIFINPKILKISKKIIPSEEGCLSVRPLYGTTYRHSNLTVEANDENGNKFNYGASGLIAHIIQHEIDHLEGILFIDHAENIQAVDLEEVKKAMDLEKNKNNIENNHDKL